MDFGLYGRVIWRFKYLIAVGLVVACVLAVYSVARISPSGITYRHSALWSATTRLGVTQNGFPWGRLLVQQATPQETAAKLGIPVADPNRLDGLAVLYAELATSDPVRAVLSRTGPIRGQIIASPVVVGDSRILLPLIDVTAISTTPAAAVKLARRSASALDTYLREQQGRNRVPDSDRVVVQIVSNADGAQVFQPRSKTLAIIVFVAVLAATLGLAFLLENLRPRLRTASVPAEQPVRGTAQRLSA